MPEQFYRSEEVTLAAGEVRVLNYDFVPDQILIVPRLDSIITDNIAVRPVGAQGGASHQLRGPGPLVVPGLSKQLQVKNNDPVSRIIIVTAQKGYLPTSAVMPTSLTADVGSRTRYTNLALAGGGGFEPIVTVPAEETWTVQNISVQYTGTPPAALLFALQIGGLNYIIKQFSPISSAGWNTYDHAGLTLLADDVIAIGIFNATAGDDLVATVIATKR